MAKAYKNANIELIYQRAIKVLRALTGEEGDRSLTAVLSRGIIALAL